MVLLLLLAFSKRDEENRFNWENMALACVFSLVFIGFWIVITPYGSFADDIFNMGHVRWLVGEGSIPVGHQNLWYFDFPGMHLLVTALAQLTGLGVFESRMLFLLVNAALFSVLLYILFAKLLKSNRLAFIGVMLVMMSSVMLIEKMHIFTPGALGYTLLAGFLVMMTSTETRLLGTAISDRLLMLILFAAMVISYFATSFLAPLVLLGIYLLQKISRGKEAQVSLLTVVLLLVMVLAWEVYWTWKLFDSLAGFLPRLGDSMLSGGFLSIPFRLAQANVGGELPLWATLTRTFWWASLGLGTILGLFNLFRARSLGFSDKVVTGGLLGVILLTIIGVFGTHGGQQFGRFLLYAPLLCIPLLLVFLSRIGGRLRTSYVLLTVLLLVVSLPTMLSSVNLVSTEAISPYECSAGRFMEANIRDKGEDDILYGLSSASKAWVYYYAPDTRTKQVSEKAFYEKDEAEVWEETDKIVMDFRQEWVALGTHKLFVLSEKDTTFYQHLLNILPEYPNWEELAKQLAAENRIFINGYVEMYAPTY